MTGQRNPGALAGAAGAELELQAGAAFHLGHYPNHREVQALRLARLRIRYGIHGPIAAAIASLAYDGGPVA